MDKAANDGAATGFAVWAALRHDAAVTASLPRLIELSPDHGLEEAGSPSLDTLGAMPAIGFRRISGALPPRDLDRGILVVPDALVAPLSRVIAESPQAGSVALSLVRATSSLPAHDALAIESLAYSLLQAGSEYQKWISQRSPRADVPVDGPQIACELRGNTVEIIIDRPDRANAINRVMRHELVELLTGLAHSSLLITIRGCGRNFSAGGDLAEFGVVDDPVLTHIRRTAQGLPEAFAGVSPRVTAQVHGPNVGAGVELLAFASRVVADPGATFRLPEVRMGLIPGCGGTVSLPRRIGANRALIMMLTDLTLDAEAAREWQLVDEVTAWMP